MLSDFLPQGRGTVLQDRPYSGAARLAREPDGTGEILCAMSCTALPASAWLLLSTAPATTVLICKQARSRGPS